MSDKVYLTTDEDAFDSIEDAMNFIGNVASDKNDAIGWVINICKKIESTHNDFIDAKDLINKMQCEAYDGHSEWSEDYLSDIEYDDEKIKALNALLEKWFDENASQPRFWKAGEEVDCLIVTKELLDKHEISF